MNTPIAPLNNERGSVLLVAVLIIPILTLLCFFASQISVQDLQVTTNDKCHRIAFYNSDGGIYGTAKLISDTIKVKDPKKDRQPLSAGEGQDAPGIQYINAESDPAEGFLTLLTSEKSKDTTEDVAFVKIDPENDIGLDSTVDITKGPGGIPPGGGAEFGVGAEGIGTGINVVIFRLRSQGRSTCADAGVTVIGDYWMITSKAGATKGI